MSAVVALACGPGVPGGSEGASATSEMMGSETSGGGSTSGTQTSAVTSGTSDDGLSEHGPCPNGDECSLCVQSEGASICGPECYELGPGPAPGRCPPSPVQQQSICPWESDVPGVCLIMCGVAADCPDPGMVCVVCPEPYKQACDTLWGFAGVGPNICAWPAG